MSSSLCCRASLGHVGALVLLVAVTVTATRPPSATAATARPLLCSDPDPPEYYSFALVTTKNVPGTGLAGGTAEVTYAASPFGVSIAPDGSYLYDVHTNVTGLRPPARGVYVVWVTSSDVAKVERVGVLPETGHLTGQVAWNKFLVVITLEERDDPAQTTWSGPIALRGMSRSGMMHTMAGHGPLQQENCAAWGYDE